MFLAAVVQMTSTSDPETNWAQARSLVERAAGYGAKFVATPENTNYLGPPAEKVRTAESLDGPTCRRFAGGRWTFDGTTLTLTWPRHGGAPKVNTVRLSDDATTYQGKNDRDWVVKGVKIPDQP